MQKQLDSDAMVTLAHSPHVTASQLTLFVMRNMENSISMKKQLNTFSEKLDHIETALNEASHKNAPMAAH